ncbi:TRC40/GET3/ArsA family transport-energizing ATPase [Actinomycetospora corticicola]|uniref:Arsenite-transporting ATPase n=1 Tax=Actinomycetospora corticicola TaxID=663602 RepID=A0A7Y9DUQ0_9PSEU|nr:arsenite-transporting ATPase [Actinomycetospora corticicola]
MRVLLFTGKGGVGKTTTAAATAVALARSGRKVLVLSTDPAHSLGDAFDVPLGGEPTEIDGVALPGLFAAHVDTRALVDEAWEPLRAQLRTLLAGAGVEDIVADELTVLPGVEDLLALEQVRRATEDGPWEVVVVDCGPTAETLRLLSLPEAFGGYLERLFPAHRRAVRGVLAGLAGSGATVAKWDAAAASLSRLAEQLSGLRAMLADRSTTTIRLVLTPERVVAAETRRTITALALHELHVDGLIANRLVPDPGAGRSAAVQWLRVRRGEQDGVLAELAELTAGTGVGLRTVAHRAGEPVGVAELAELAEDLYGTDDPLEGVGARPLMELRRTAGEGTSVDSEYELDLQVPGIGDGEVDLARIGDDLAVTVGRRRRTVALPPVLRRCEVVAAELDDDVLSIAFRPDPAVWMR